MFPYVAFPLLFPCINLEWEAVNYSKSNEICFHLIFYHLRYPKSRGKT